MYSKCIGVSKRDIYEYNNDVNYFDILTTITSNQYCRQFNYTGGEIVLSDVTYAFRSMMTRSFNNVKLTEIDVHVFCKSIKVFSEIANNGTDEDLKDKVFQLFKCIEHKYSLDNGQTTVSIEAFRSQIFMSMINFIGAKGIELKFTVPYKNSIAFSAIKSLFLLNDIYDNMNRNELSEYVEEFAIQKC